MKGDLNSEKEILVLGDSHAAMLNHFFDYLGKALGFKARIITASSCVTIPGFNYQRLPEWARKECITQIEQAKAKIEYADNIFLAASWLHLGCILAASWLHLGCILAASWLHLGVGSWKVKILRRH
ncbi:SGNH hydrolase domain-containing protein [Aeromonas allosaccharophila]